MRTPKSYPQNALMARLRVGPALAMMALSAVVTTGQEDEEPAYELSPFEVSVDAVGYYATNALGATKTNVPIRDLPMNIQVLTREFIEDVNAVTIDDAVRYSASINASTNEPGRFSMRGFSQPTPMRNGMDTLAESNFFGTGTIERVEVVKGPSAILYGITEPGGLVNIITKKPQFDRFGSLSFQIGDYSTVRAEADVTGPIGRKGETKLAYRLIASYNDIGYEQQWAFDETKTIAPSLRVQFSQKTSLLAAVEYQELRSNPRGGTIIKIGTEDDGELAGERIGYVQQRNDYGISSYFDWTGPDNKKDTDTLFASLDFHHRFNEDFAFRVIVNHTDTSLDQDIRTGHGVERMGPDGELGWIRTIFLARFVDREELTAQAEFNGRFSTGEVDHNFVVGYERTEFEQDQVAWRENNALPLTDLKDPSTWNFNITIPPLERALNPANFTRYQDTSSAYGVHQMAMFNERLHTLLGVRYDLVEASTLDRNSGSRSEDPETTNTTPQVGLLYDITRNVGVFASYSESFSPNVQVNPDGSTFAPATGEGIDVGIKFSTEDNRYNATISIFEIDKTNIVRRDSERSEQTNQLWFNTSGLERSKGYEIDIVVTPIDNYQLSLSYAYVDAYIASNTDNPTWEGRQISDSPDHSVSFWNKYTFRDGALDGVFIGAGVIYRDKTEISENPVNQYLFYPSYTVLDMVVGYRTELWGQNWEFSVRGNNLTDEWYNDRQRNIANGRNFQLLAKVRF